MTPQELELSISGAKKHGKLVAKKFRAFLRTLPRSEDGSFGKLKAPEYGSMMMHMDYSSLADSMVLQLLLTKYAIDPFSFSELGQLPEHIKTQLPGREMLRMELSGGGRNPVEITFGKDGKPGDETLFAKTVSERWATEIPTIVADLGLTKLQGHLLRGATSEEMKKLRLEAWRCSVMAQVIKAMSACDHTYHWYTMLSTGVSIPKNELPSYAALNALDIAGPPTAH